MARRSGCVICGDDTGGRQFSKCGRCEAIKLVVRSPAPASRREPGSDDMSRQSSARAVAQATEEQRQLRHLERIDHVRATFEKQRRCLLARALDPRNDEWTRCEIRVSLPKPK